MQASVKPIELPSWLQSRHMFKPVESGVTLVCIVFFCLPLHNNVGHKL